MTNKKLRNRREEKREAPFTMGDLAATHVGTGMCHVSYLAGIDGWDTRLCPLIEEHRGHAPMYLCLLSLISLVLVGPTAALNIMCRLAPI